MTGDELDDLVEDTNFRLHFIRFYDYNMNVSGTMYCKEELQVNSTNASGISIIKNDVKEGVTERIKNIVLNDLYTYSVYPYSPW